jgi:hypothetical protein
MLPGAFAASADAKLFFTPAERARVTAERAAMLAIETEAGGAAAFTSAVAPAIPAAAAGKPRLEGVSLPGSGRAHAWIGGRRYQDGELYHGQRVRVLRNGVQLVGAGANGRTYRVGEAMPGTAPR